MGLSVEIDHGIEEAGLRLVKRSEAVLHGNDDVFVVQVAEELSFACLGELLGGDVVQKDDGSFGIWNMVQFVDELLEVLACLARIFFCNCVQVRVKQFLFENPRNVSDGLLFPRPGCSAKKEPVDADVVPDGLDYAYDVRFDGCREQQRILRRFFFFEECLRHKRVRARHEGNNVLRKLGVAAGVKIACDFIGFLTESDIVFLGIVTNQVDDILFFSWRCPLFGNIKHLGTKCKCFGTRWKSAKFN